MPTHFTAGKTLCLEYLCKKGLIPLRDVVMVDLDVIRAMLPEAKELCRKSPLEYGERTQREAGTIAEICLLYAACCGRHVIVEGTMRDVGWHCSYLCSLKEQVAALRSKLVTDTHPGGRNSGSECDDARAKDIANSAPNILVGVLHMTASVAVIRQRVRMRESSSSSALTKRGQQYKNKSSGRCDGGRQSGSISARPRPAFRPAGRADGSRQQKPPLPPRRPSRVVPIAALNASLCMGKLSSLRAILEVLKPTSPSLQPLAGNQKGLIDLVVSLDLSEKEPRIKYPWHLDWPAFTAAFDSRLPGLCSTQGTVEFILESKALTSQSPSPPPIFVAQKWHEQQELVIPMRTLSWRPPHKCLRPVALSPSITSILSAGSLNSSSSSKADFAVTQVRFKYSAPPTPKTDPTKKVEYQDHCDVPSHCALCRRDKHPTCLHPFSQRNVW